jgi:hypothetical protein
MSWLPDVLDALLTPLVIISEQRKNTRAESTTQEYLKALDPDRLLSSLDSALAYSLPGDRYQDQVFYKFATGAPAVWNQDCFKRFLQAQYGNVDIMKATKPLLWHCFATAANFPFPLSATYVVDKPAFSRAFALLVFQGIQLLGTRRDGLQCGRTADGGFARKIPRIARFIYTCLARHFPDLDGSQSNTESAQERILQNCHDCVYFAQPLTDPSYKLVGKSTADRFRDAAQRLVECGAGSDETFAPHQVQSADLRGVLKMLLLVCVRNEVWKEGPTIYSTLRSADTLYSHLDVTPGNLKQVSELLDPMMSHLFEQSVEPGVSLEDFERCCKRCVSNACNICYSVED